MKKVLLIVFIFAAIVVLYFAYSVINSRYTAENEGEDVSVSEELQEEETVVTEEENKTEETEESSDTENTESETISEKPQLTKDDCSNECADYINNKRNLKYCRKLCGYFPVQKREEITECKGLSVDEKYFCLYDLAVSKKDFKICDGITDRKTRDACNNRVIEEIFNGS